MSLYPGVGEWPINLDTVSPTLVKLPISRGGCLSGMACARNQLLLYQIRLDFAKKFGILLLPAYGIEFSRNL